MQTYWIFKVECLQDCMDVCLVVYVVVPKFHIAILFPKGWEAMEEVNKRKNQFASHLII